MPQQAKHFYEFSSFRLDAVRRVLFMEKEPLPLPPKVFDTLLVLVQRRGQVVEKDELMKLLWPDSFVEEANLSQNVSMLRKVLGESPNDHHYIVTLPGRGYRFVAEVTELGHDEETDLIIAERTRSRIVITQDGKASPPSEEEKVLLAAQEKPLIPGESFVEVGGSSRMRAPWLSPKAIALATLLITVLGVGLLSIWLFRGRPATHQLEIKSIAVLPLENLSGDSSQDYFADGMTEALITDLGKISAFRVISRTSVMHYKGTAKTVPEIARELNVDAMVEGAVMRSGDRVRITAQLIQAATDKHLWAETYERDLRDVLALQSEVARDIANKIQIKVTPQQQARLASARPVDPEAYEAYLKGRHLQILDSAKAVEFHQRATQIDPTWAPPHAAIVVPTLDLGLPPMEVCAKARAAAGKALLLDDTLSEAYSSMAWVRHQCDWDWPGTERDFKRAIELDPSNSQARHFYSHYLLAMRRFDESLIESKRALELDPLSELLNTHLAWHYLRAHQPDPAIEQCRKAIEVFPNSVLGHNFRMGAYEMKGMYEQAITDVLDSKAAARLKRAYGLFGAHGYWQSSLDSFLQGTRQHYSSPLTIAGFYAQLGQRNEAFAWLEKAYDERAMWMPELRCDPRVDPLRSDPRFQDLLRRMNFPP